MSALSKIKKIYPQVTKVVDAKKTISINVKDIDNKAGRKKDFAECALAKACKRTKIADSVLIGLTTSYLIKGNIATRYKTSEAVSREIVSFDRHQDFASGRNYKLSKINKAMKLGTTTHRGGESSGKLGPRKRINHRTADVRQIQSL